MSAEDKMYILVGTLFGWNINLALFYNLNVIKVYINLQYHVIRKLNFT
jgi:hypothetical protein